LTARGIQSTTKPIVLISFRGENKRITSLANDWIEGLVNGENVLCCGANDCYPLKLGALQLSPDGDFTVEIGGRWFPVLERYLLRDRSPDGRAWACPQWESINFGLSPVRGVRCLLLPMTM
jgi:hypothetical protein